MYDRLLERAHSEGVWGRYERRREHGNVAGVASLSLSLSLSVSLSGSRFLCLPVSFVFLDSCCCLLVLVSIARRV